MARVKLEKVTKKFGAVTVVRELDLEVEDREFLVLVGPSGCGKSTTLRMIAGLEDPTEGRIIIGERVVNHLAPRDRDIAMVFQNYALYPHMTVYGNMAFGLRLRKLSRAETDERVRAAARMLGLEELLERKPRELSGGQRQRVALGRAVVRDPRVFLFDEPLSNLDAKLRGQMRAELARLHARLAVTSVYVTHDQMEAMTLGSRIAVMDQGVIQQLGPPIEVYERPANIFVAGFIGSPQMNFFRGRVSGRRFSGGGLELELPPGLASAAGPEREIVLGLRPEAFLPATGAGTAGLRALVEVVEPLGAETLVVGRIGDFPFTARLRPDIPAAVGDALPLAPDLERARLFDPDSGAALQPA